MAKKNQKTGDANDNKVVKQQTRNGKGKGMVSNLIPQKKGTGVHPWFQGMDE